VVLTNNAAGADFYQWEFGDGNSSTSAAATVNHTYAIGGSVQQNYVIRLVTTTVQGCADTAQQGVVVFPPITADFTGDTIGCSPLPVQFLNQSTGAANYIWDFGNGNGSAQLNPDETYFYNGSTDTTYIARLEAISIFGCRDTATQSIRVFPAPVGGFLATPLLQTFPSSTVNLVNQTIGNWNWNWSFGNGTGSTQRQPGSVTYNDPGQYTIRLILTNGYCGDTVSQTVNIIPPPPVAAFIGSEEGCAPLTVTFTNQSQFATTYLWEFGDGNEGSQLNPTYTYFQPGVYTVKLTASGLQGISTVIKVDSIRVYEAAVAQFDVRPNRVTVPSQAAQFINLSSNADRFFWDFGDGGTSTEEFPGYAYREPGSYTPILVADNQFGCPDTFVASLPITAELGGSIRFPNAFVPDPNGQGGGGFYDPSALDNTVFFPIVTGATEYHLMIFNRWGEMVFETRDVQQGWDGFYRGELCQQDAYVWKVEVTYANGQEETKVGDVTLLR